jgi:predicted phosphate transport protein (TIGR00153 family)
MNGVVIVAFPRETEEQIRRGVLDICQDHIRVVLDAVRELTNMVFDFSEKTYDNIASNLSQIKKLKEEATEHRLILLNELAESGMLLLNREDFLRLAVQIGEIADYCEGAAYRISHVASKKLKIDNELRESLFNLSKNVLKTVTNLRETILALKYSRSRAISMAKNVAIAEYIVDEMFREIEFKILNAKMNLETTLLMRDLTNFLEDIADKAEDASDSTRILALGV